MFVGNPREPFNVGDISRRIPDTFAEYRSRILVDQLFYIFGTFTIE